MSIGAVAPERNNDSGQYTDSYPDRDFIAALHEHGGAAGTSDVAEHVGCVRDSAYRRLNQLAEQGMVERQKVGNSLVWSVTDKGRDALDD